MRILEQNTGEEKEVVAVIKSNIFVCITDYKKKLFLKEIKVGPGQHHWCWVDPDPRVPIDISDIGDRYSTFDNALNRAINDAYCTVYDFNSWIEMIANWDDMVYVDKIKTVYQSEES